MKKNLALPLALAALLASCGSSYNVRLANGSIIKANENEHRTFSNGDTVCIYQLGYNSWEIDSNGNMKDTTIAHMTRDSLYLFQTWKTGIIIP